MTNIKNAFQDGANYQAQCVLLCLRDFNIEKSWSQESRRYEAEINFARWENCREQGYVLMLRNKKGKQLNIVFFEHRNSDAICAVKWEQSTINAPTIDTAKFGNVYKDKHDVSHSVGCHQFDKMAKWVSDQFEEHWD